MTEPTAKPEPTDSDLEGDLKDQAAVLGWSPATLPAPVLSIGRRIKALIEKGDRAADKAEQFYKAAGLHIKEIKDKRPEDWDNIVREICDVGRSRAYELMAIADGRTTLEKVRASTNERQKIHRGKSVRDKRTDPDEERDRKEIVALNQKADVVADDEPEALKALPNGARAIMGSRVEAAKSLDYSPTPPFATRALIERVLPVLNISRACLTSVHEPACGEGHMAEVLAEYFRSVGASDIRPDGYGYGEGGRDFLAPDFHVVADWIITNPPFREKAEQFALKALELARVGVAIFARLQWLETIGRYQRLFRDQPPTLIAFFCERVALHMGEWDPDGGTATAYIWLVWLKGRFPRAPLWIAPCRKELTHPDDEARFTKHPVIKKQHPRRHDPQTDGKQKRAVLQDKKAIDDDLSIPEFLRRGDAANKWLAKDGER